MVKSLRDIEIEFIDPQKAEKAADIFALCVLFWTAIKPPNYSLDETGASHLGLSDYGIRTAQLLKARLPWLNDQQVKEALITDLYHEDLYFDASNTNAKQFLHALSKDVAVGNLKYPWIYGGTLYFRANTIFQDMGTSFTPDETAHLLGGTPQGVFQMRQYVTGPFGILLSKQLRDIGPIQNIPLWHCSDPSCRVVHSVTLTQPPRPIDDAIQFLKERARLVQAFPWPTFYGRLSQDGEYYDDYYTREFPSFLGNAFSERELQKILRTLLERPQGLRAHLTALNLGTKLSGSASEISGRLNAAECLQLVLLERDEATIDSIEQLIATKSLNIPASEIRSSNHRSGWYRVSCEASCHGVRFKSADRGVASARLKKLIQQIYEPSGNSRDLGWRLRYSSGESDNQKLDNYIDTTAPEAVITGYNEHSRAI